MTRFSHITLILCAFVAGCTASAPRLEPAVGLVPDAAGLQPNGTELRIDFGRAQAGVIQSVSRLKAQTAAPPVVVPGCGVLVVWPDGLGLVFIDGNFRGWVQGDRFAGVKCA